jgi:hypothetical protein
MEKSLGLLARHALPVGREREAISVTDDSRGPGGDALAYFLCRKLDIKNQATTKTVGTITTNE